MLEVLEHARSTELLELSIAESRLSSESAAEVARLVGEVGSEVEDYLGFAPWLQRYEETYDEGSGDELLRLSVPYVEPGSVSVTVAGDAFTDFSVHRSGFLERDSGVWTVGSEVVVDYRSGFVLDAWLVTWSASKAIVAGDWFVTDPRSTSRFLFEATTVGNTGGSAPDWSSAAAVGDTLTDGDVVWTARDALLLPKVFRGWAWAGIHHAHGLLTRDPALASQRVDGFAESYRDTGATPGLPAVVRAGLDRWREVTV